MKKTLINIAERVLATFAAALLGFITVSGVTISHVHWGIALDTAGTAALITLLKCMGALAVTGTPSLALRKQPPVTLGRHEASEG